MKFMKIHGKLERKNSYLMVKMTFYQLFSVMLDILWAWKIQLDLVSETR